MAATAIPPRFIGPRRRGSFGQCRVPRKTPKAGGPFTPMGNTSAGAAGNLLWKRWKGHNKVVRHDSVKRPRHFQSNSENYELD